MMLTYKIPCQGRDERQVSQSARARGELWMELLLRDPARSAAALEGGNAVLLADRVRPDQVVHGDRRRSWTALRYGSYQTVCRQFIASRDAKRGCPRFRASSGPRRKLGWIAFIPP